MNSKTKRVLIFAASASVVAAYIRSPAHHDILEPVEIKYEPGLDIPELRLEPYQRQAPRPRDLYKQKRRGK